MSKRIVFAGLLLLIVLTGIILSPQPTFASTCQSTIPIEDPIDFVWTIVDEGQPNEHYVGVLEYGEATFNINGETLTTRAYRQQGGSFSIPGPTIRMAPGNKYVLQFHNLLDYELPSETHNDFKDPNITNIHTHGLHISGEAPGDDVTRMFEGGYGGDYVYDIPEDHMGGTYWYHAHHHGSTFLQVSTGGFGLIIIDDFADGIPENVAAMEERQVIIGYLDRNAAGTGGDTLVSGSLTSGWTVNGKRNGELCISPDTWYHFRVLLADRDSKLKDVVIGETCETMLLARDGVWRTVAPKALTDGTINITGASRADLAVRCSADSSISVNNEIVANILVNGVEDTGPHPFAPDGVSTWSATRPDYLRDLRNEPVVHKERINMGARTVNGEKFNLLTPTLTLDATDIQEWNIKGASNHPFHLHIYHFQAMAGCGGDFEEGEYYDTLAGSCNVRFDLNAYTSSVYAGRTIMHCHILEHEDQGAMGWLKVNETPGTILNPQFPDGGYSAYYSLSGDPPTIPADPTNLIAGNPTSTSIDLNWDDNANNEDGFEIYRSEDGINFNPLNTTGANTNSYVDTGLTSEKTYWYKVLAYNTIGDSAFSNTDSETTLSGNGPTSVEIGSVLVSTAGVGKGQKVGQATIIVVDDLGNPVEGAFVTGDFTGTFTEPGVSGTTDSTGTTVLQTSESAKGGVTIEFCVTSITHPTLNDWAGDPVCGSN